MTALGCDKVLRRSFVGSEGLGVLGDTIYILFFLGSASLVYFFTTTNILPYIIYVAS